MTLPVDRRKRLLNPCGRTGTDTADGVSPRSSCPFDFSVSSGGDRFENSFLTFGCLISRYGRLFVESLNREDHRARKNEDRHRGRSQWSRLRIAEERGHPVLPQSVCCSREISEGLATDWPIGQPVASRLASPISFNLWGLGFFWQDWPGWPKWRSLRESLAAET